MKMVRLSSSLQKYKYKRIDHLYCSDAKKRRYSNNHPPISVDLPDIDLEYLKGLLDYLKRFQIIK